MPEISVIIPVYNKRKYIETTLRSVLEQSFCDLEVIAVNDGSTDESLVVLNQMAEVDQRVRVIDIPNGGVSNARNVGLACARGQWIQFLDADDLLEPEYFSKVMDFLKENPVDILFSGFTMVDSNMNLIKEIALPEEGFKNQEQLCRSFIQYQYNNGFFGFISNKFFRRSLVERSGARFPVGTTLAEDLDFYARLYPAVEAAYFWSGKSFCYLQTETNYTHNVKIDYYSQLEIHLDIKSWFQKSGLYLTYKDQLDSKIAQYAAYILFYDHEDGKDLSEGFAFLRGRPEIMACIDPRYMNGFYKLILMALKKGKLSAIKGMFAIRSGARSLYRSIKHYE